jgi:hypothetical protein
MLVMVRTEIGDLVAGLGRIEHLEERDAVDGHRGVVLGDHLLFGNVDHLLHHVDLAADAVEIRHDDVEPGRQRVRVFAEPLDSPVIALRHRLDAGKQGDDDKQNKDNRENIETGHKSSMAGHDEPIRIPRQNSYAPSPSGYVGKAAAPVHPAFFNTV